MEQQYEMVNHPDHYNNGSIETIEKIRRIWGNKSAALWCEITAFKYRDRIGTKPGQPVEQELGKINWYEKEAKRLYSIIDEEQAVDDALIIAQSSTIYRAARYLRKIGDGEGKVSKFVSYMEKHITKLFKKD